MFVERNGYFEIEDFKKFGLKAIYTAVEIGDLMKDEAREKAVQILNLKNYKIYSGHQTHSKNIETIKEDTPLFVENCDGFITNLKDVAIFTKYADCLPVYFYDEKTKAFGCVHSGWQGSFQKIAIEAIEKMKAEYGSKVEDIVVAFGIGISKEKYEVGDEFYEKFKNEFPKDILENVFDYKNGKYYFDNQEFNYNLLIKNGVLEKNIFKNKLCTFSEKKFHSYRRDKKDSGRNGAYIFIDSESQKW